MPPCAGPRARRQVSDRPDRAREAGYPSRLLTLSDAPASWGARLRARRRCACSFRVGARAASGAGCARARAIAAELAGKGVVIISGGAFGIDAAAHEGALAAAAAPTFAVFGWAST